MAIPQTITNDVADMISELEVTGPTELRVAAVKRKISEAKRANVAEGEMLEGMLYAVLGNYEKCDEHHRAAVNKRPGDFVLLINHGISLKKLGDFSRAYAIFKKCAELDPSSSMAIKHLINTVILSGDLSEALPLVTRYIKLNGDSDLKNEIDLFTSLLNELKEIELKETDFKRFSNKAEQLMRKHGVAVRRYASAIHQFDGCRYLSLDLDVPLAGKNLAALNDEFAASIAEDELIDHCWDKLIINFSNGLGMGVPQAFQQ